MSKRSSQQLGSSIGAVLALAAACSTASDAYARIWYVDGDVPVSGDGSPEYPFKTIGEGVTAASDADIVLVDDVDDPPYRYRGPGNRDLVIQNKAITVKSANGPTNCIIDCYDELGFPHRAFEIDTEVEEVTRIEGFTIRNGYSWQSGGAILNTGQGEFRIVNCVFEDNWASEDDYGLGGAIYNVETHGKIIKCAFTRNHADWKGGAVASFDGQVDIVNCSFVGNATYGTALDRWWAGAVDADYYHQSTLINCRFAGNVAWGGGAASCGRWCALTLINCTMSGNRATHHAGALNVDSNSDVTLQNCILWDNDVRDEPERGPEIAMGEYGGGTTLGVEYSDVAGGEAEIYLYEPNCVVDWRDGNIEDDPLFLAPGDWEDPHGTPNNWFDDVWVDGDYQLRLCLPCSPCRDAADNSAVPADEFDVDGDEDFNEPTPDLDLDERVQRCVVNMGAYEFESPCEADLEPDGDVDLGDLAGLLANYDQTGKEYADGDVETDPEGGHVCDGDVDLGDLAELLAHYGCGSGRGRDGEGGSRRPEGRGRGAFMCVFIEPYDTGGYQGGGFHGEVDHFVFDLKIEVFDPKDDWTASGALLDSHNDATFRLSRGPLVPDAYATFVAAPWVEVPGSPNGASIAGAYLPADPTYEFEATGINIAWFDMQDSHDGPATVLRLVIDVSAVEGADVSAGFGSVYFSYWAPAEPGDILVADLGSGSASCYGGGELVPLSGNFYVKGE